MNDYMSEINGWHTTEYNLREVVWRLMMFNGRDWERETYYPSNLDDKNYLHLLEQYRLWKNKRCNNITYFDSLCGIERTQRPSGYGVMQGGYLDLNSIIANLQKKGIVKIPFCKLYDIRQDDHWRTSGCYMKIVKIT